MPSPPPLHPDPTAPASPLRHDELPRLLARIWAAFHPVLMENLAEEELDGIIQPGMGHLLLALFQQDGRRIGELAKTSGVSHVAVLQMVKRLKKGNLVQMRPCHEDGRSTRVWLSPHGRAIEPKLRAVHERNLAVIETLLGADHAAQLTTLLRELANGLAEKRPPPAP